MPKASNSATLRIEFGKTLKKLSHLSSRKIWMARSAEHGRNKTILARPEPAQPARSWPPTYRLHFARPFVFFRQVPSNEIVRVRSPLWNIFYQRYSGTMAPASIRIRFRSVYLDKYNCVCDESAGRRPAFICGFTTNWCFGRASHPINSKHAHSLQ